MRVNIANEKTIEKKFSSLKNGEVFKIYEDNSLYLVTNIKERTAFDLNEDCKTIFDDDVQCILYSATIKAERASKSTT